MLAKCYSGAIIGVEARTIEIEVNSAIGTSQFAIVGLPDTAVKEAKDRIPTALKNQGFASKREFDITVNLAPADVRKEGPIYDLPIAICLLKAMGKIHTRELSEYAFVGELALSGEVRRVRGVLPMVVEMRRIGRRMMFVPFENSEEASVIDGIDIIPVKTLQEVVQYLNGERVIEPRRTNLAELLERNRDEGEDFSDVKGQEGARKAIEVAVAGGHNLLMIGSPGSGKTMLARRIPSILPPLTVEEALEVSRIHSVAGREKSVNSFVTQRPFRAPHHTASSIGLLGGGAHPMPGEVSLAHRGVLFLDEFAEFPRNVLEVLRQPLEDGRVGVSRAHAAHNFPSKFMLVAAMNPCPCGYYGDDTHHCHCTVNAIARYQNRISGPLLDRIDIHIEVPPVKLEAISRAKDGESSASIRERVLRVRAIQEARYCGMSGVHTNAEAKSRDLMDVCQFTVNDHARIVKMIEKLNLSARSYDKVLKVARTIADLAGAKAVRDEDILMAIGYRRLVGREDSYWM